jgi:hypothetical protein
MQKERENSRRAIVIYRYAILLFQTPQAINLFQVLSIVDVLLARNRKVLVGVLSKQQY